MRLRELALGRPYFAKKKLLQQTEFFSAEKLSALQMELLGNTLEQAAEVPFYSEILRLPEMKGLEPKVLLQRLPVIDKETVRNRLNDFCRSQGYKAIKATTGGSTGQPFVFYMNRFKTRQMEKAFIFDQWGRVGYQMGDPVFNLRGRTPSKGRLTEHDRLFNIHFASSFDLKLETVERYVRAVDDIQPKFLHGYPSTMYQLAALMEQAEKRFLQVPQAIFCGSEKLFPYQRELIENVFGCRVYSWYGHSECLALGGECEKSQTLHFYPQYGYVEMLPTGSFNAHGKEIYEIVATGFNNSVMPLIRYRTGDYAVLKGSQQCSCRRNYLLVEEVLGREQEFIIDKQGELISATSLIFGQHFALFSGLDGLFLRQMKPGEFTVILKKNTQFIPEDFSRMQQQINELVGERFQVEYEFADEIPRSKIGKARLVQQELSVNHYLNTGK